MIHLHGLVKRYPGSPSNALDGVTLTLESGEFAFLGGPSGSGKTTLLRILVGLDRPTSGEVVVAGRNLMSISNTQLSALRRRVGFVFQNFRLLAHRTALENVSLPLLVRGIAADECERRAMIELDRMGLADQADALPITLSAGEQQRVAIARALVGEPALLLADEPTGNLDPDLSLRMMELFVDAQARGSAVLIATHDPMIVERLRKRTLRMERGKIVDDTLPPGAIRSVR